MPPSFHLMLLPGLGADERLFGPQREAFPGLEVPPWITPRPRESLPAYARRLAAGLRPGQPLVLGGVSLGGMVALELAGHLHPAAVVLIATCRTPRAIAPWLRLCAGVAGALPRRLIDCSKPMAPLATGRTSGCGRQHASLAARMYQDADSRFMHWACRAVLGWQPTPKLDCPVFQIHGGADRVIPAIRAGADVVVPGGGHLINLTHAEVVNRFIAAAAEKTI
jgi:pimeloyl-ACP methyl ester carboxylesterase